jgi:hypothetical protein
VIGDPGFAALFQLVDDLTDLLGFVFFADEQRILIVDDDKVLNADGCNDLLLVRYK